MLGLDTHVWVWSVDGDTGRIGRRTRQMLQRAQSRAAIRVSPMAIFELAALHTLGRVRLARSLDQWVRDALDTVGVRIAELTPAIALDAVFLSSDRRILDYASTTGNVRVHDAGTSRWPHRHVTGIVLGPPQGVRPSSAGFRLWIPLSRPMCRTEQTLTGAGGTIVSDATESMLRILDALAIGTVMLLASAAPADAQESSSASEGPSADRRLATLEDAQLEYYNARYESAAALTVGSCTTDVNDLAACELLTAALLFQIRSALGPSAGKEKAWKQCVGCPALLSAFNMELARGQALARARLRENPLDDETLFLLGKLDLNYVWLQLGTLGRKTGWDEYWEGRRALDIVLARQPGHVRARVARGWVEYIVATKVPRAARWLLGGGSKKRGLLAIREAAGTEADFFTRTEARFALWDVQVREHDAPGALATASILIRDFPDNPELRRFVETHRPAASSASTSPVR